MKAQPEPTGAENAWQRLRARRPARWSLYLLITLSMLSFLTPALPLADPALPALDHKLEAPCWPAFHGGWQPGVLDREQGHMLQALVNLRQRIFGDLQLAPALGTDQLGRCVLARILWGSRISLLVGLVASLISLVLGVTWGAVAGLAGGRLDALMMRLVDLLYALPLMFIVIFVVSWVWSVQASNPDFPLSTEVVLFAVIGAISWLVMARLVRAQTRALKNAPFMEAARAAGTPPLTMLTRHVLPNLMPLAIVTLTLTTPRVILMEAYLSFLGLGVDAPHVSWGLLAWDGFSAVTAVHVTWWLLVFPGLFLGATLFALNTLGDALRDALDPLLRSASEEQGLEELA